MEVIVLAGGLGTRLRSAIGNEIPKCMAPICDKPFLRYLLEYLRRFDVSRVILSVGYLRDVIFKWVDENRQFFPFEICYAVEETPLGTGGGIRLAARECKGQDAIVLNGDTFFDVDLAQFHALHTKGNCPVSLALKRMRNFDRYGTVVVGTDGKISRFCEKQPCADGLINGGIYCITLSQPAIWPEKEKFSFETDMLEPLAAKGSLAGFECDGYFKDIGIPADYAQAAIDFKDLFR